MSRNFATPQFIPQSPLQRRRVSLRDTTTYDDHDAANQDDEISFRPITPQRRLSVTRSTPNSLFKSPRTPHTPFMATPHGKVRAYDPNMTITDHIDKTFSGQQHNDTQIHNDNVVHYTTTNQLTPREAYFKQLEALEVEMAKAPQIQ